MTTTAAVLPWACGVPRSTVMDRQVPRAVDCFFFRARGNGHYRFSGVFGQLDAAAAAVIVARSDGSESC